MPLSLALAKFTLNKIILNYLVNSSATLLVLLLISLLVSLLKTPNVVSNYLTDRELLFLTNYTFIIPTLFSNIIKLILNFKLLLVLLMSNYFLLPKLKNLKSKKFPLNANTTPLNESTLLKTLSICYVISSKSDKPSNKTIINLKLNPNQVINARLIEPYTFLNILILLNPLPVLPPYNL